jgi:hypothetical protein
VVPIAQNINNEISVFGHFGEAVSDSAWLSSYTGCVGQRLTLKLHRLCRTAPDSQATRAVSDSAWLSSYTGCVGQRLTLKLHRLCRPAPDSQATHAVTVLADPLQVKWFDSIESADSLCTVLRAWDTIQCPAVTNRVYRILATVSSSIQLCCRQVVSYKYVESAIT